MRSGCWQNVPTCPHWLCKASPHLEYAPNDFKRDRQIFLKRKGGGLRPSAPLLSQVVRYAHHQLELSHRFLKSYRASPMFHRQKTHRAYGTSKTFPLPLPVYGAERVEMMPTIRDCLPVLEAKLGSRSTILKTSFHDADARPFSRPHRTA